MPERAIDRAWRKIFQVCGLERHDFGAAPYEITAEAIKRACQDFQQTNEKEVRILCKQDRRESRPQVFAERNLFLLPVKNGVYKIIQGEGYVDIPPITSPLLEYESHFPFTLETANVGDSEMQHLDYAFALSLIRHFIGDQSLTLTIRGRKYTPEFHFTVGGFPITVASVQTEVDAGYEGRNRVALVEAKSLGVTNTIIRQLYYPYRQWQAHTTKPVSVLFFARERGPGRRACHLWEFYFRERDRYNSIALKRSKRYTIRHSR